jgi:high-affinity Fe2+/Pb2+ permease
MASIQTFLIISTCFLYLVAAGLFSKAVWLFEDNKVSYISISLLTALSPLLTHDSGLN